MSNCLHNCPFFSARVPVGFLGGSIGTELAGMQEICVSRGFLSECVRSCVLRGLQNPPGNPKCCGYFGKVDTDEQRSDNCPSFATKPNYKGRTDEVREIFDY